MDTTRTNAGRQPADTSYRVSDPGPIPNYDVLRFIASGGFGDVWLARERVTGLRRVIKVLFKVHADRAARDVEGVTRYQRVAHNHPHLLQILTVGANDRCYYYVMEAADNRLAAAVDDYEPTTLRSWMAARGRVAPRTALELLAKLLSGVRHLHGQGLAHYDLKPENILMVDSEPKIADVGLVAPTSQPAPRSGTPVYMTPEDRPDDLYALGKILCELISGRPPGDFPRLPREVARETAPELSAALRIVNRACRTDPTQRFRSADEMLSAVDDVLRQGHGPRAWWRRRHVAVRLAAVLLAVGTLAAGLFAAARLGLDWTEGAASDRPAPKPRLLKAAEWSLEVGDLRRLETYGQPEPYLRLRGAPLPSAGLYVYELSADQRPGPNFVVDFHLRVMRPWGTLALGVGEQAGWPGSVQATLHGQPDGLGARITLSGFNEHGVQWEAEEPIIGHPQPGEEYVLRLIRRGDDVGLAVWPLFTASAEPIVSWRPIPTLNIEPRYLLVAGAACGPLEAVELLGVRCAGYAAPLRRASDELPAPVANVLARGPLPPTVPPLLDVVVPPGEDLLAGRWHPQDSGAWSAVGWWSWWSGTCPGPGKPVRCVPFSTVERRQRIDPDWYAGVHLLRFDGAALGDFEAAVRICLARTPDGQECSPFPCDSHEGFVGLAFRMPDTVAAGAPFAGGYSAHVLLGPDRGGNTRVNMQRFDGWRRGGRYSQAWGPLDEATLATNARDPGLRAALLDPAGFTLTVRAVGPQFQLRVNDRLVLEATDPRSDYFRKGRIGLLAGRLMATFESLHITILD